MIDFFKRNMIKGQALTFLQIICQLKHRDFRALHCLGGWYGVSGELMHLYNSEVAPIKRVSGRLPDREVGALLLVTAFAHHLSLHRNYLLFDASMISTGITESHMGDEGIYMPIIEEIGQKYSTVNESGELIFSECNKLAFDRMKSLRYMIGDNLRDAGNVDDLPQNVNYTPVESVVQRCAR